METSGQNKRVKGDIELDGKSFQVEGQGEGMLEAFVDALQSTFGIPLQVLEYGEHALGQQADAEAVTYLQVKADDSRFTGIAVDKDIVTSSVNALLNAVSQILAQRRRAAA
jgi:2-isopropylmalate synthase